MKEQFKKLAREQYFNLKENLLNQDNTNVGGKNSREYTIDDNLVIINVVGCWGKRNWYSYCAISEHGEGLGVDIILLEDKDIV